MSWLPLLFWVSLAALLVFLAMRRQGAEHICTQCGTVGKPVTHTRGSIVIELVLWCLMLLPGFLYTVWRYTTRAKVCRVCKSPNVIPVSSPLGQKHAREWKTE